MKKLHKSYQKQKNYAVTFNVYNFVVYNYTYKFLTRFVDILTIKNHEKAIFYKKIKIKGKQKHIKPKKIKNTKLYP